MTPSTAGPRCPRCHRPLAAWRLEHCIYCGEAIPAELKAGHAEPEGLKWVERPPLPADLHKKLELMKIVPNEAPRKTRMAWAIAGGVALPVVIGILYLAYRLLRQVSPMSGFLIVIAGIAVVGYLGGVFFRSRNPSGPTASSSGSAPRPGR